ncbi:hypothetical protein [Aestuariivivens sediminis]|uniref:hypothetical protein n=1 Tax=Aestuariivivens sediminis TaxID=2913557 RepID=UPI001F59B7E8|nr:hypothetical protein [Aestuariivivens sediminis]
MFFKLTTIRELKLYPFYEFLMVVMVLTFSSCAIKPIPPKHLNVQRLNDIKKVGIIIRFDSINLLVDGDIGYDVYDYSPSSKYSRLFTSRLVEPLNTAYNKLNSTSEISIFYEELFKEKGIEAEELDYKPPPYPKQINDPSLPLNLLESISQFSNTDKIDAILFVDVEYGLYLNTWFYVINRVAATKCRITSKIIDLNDGSIIYQNRDSSYGGNNIMGKWNTPPEYENLTNLFKSALSAALEEERTNLNWQTINKS